MKVKVCGITNREDAFAAAELGADALGFIFVRSSPRFIQPSLAAGIIRDLPLEVTPVGVFRNASRQEVLHTVALTGVRTIQLHGDEAAPDAEGFPVPVWKAFGVDEGFRPEILARYAVAAFLLDAQIGMNSGGTGTVFDWQMAIEAKRYGDIVLAGGLSPENVALAATTVRPYAIDVNSGVEFSPGRKDHEKLRRLFASVHALNY